MKAKSLSFRGGKGGVRDGKIVLGLGPRYANQRMQFGKTPIHSGLRGRQARDDGGNIHITSDQLSRSGLMLEVDSTSRSA
jgi:hypothetical protein